MMTALTLAGVLIGSTAAGAGSFTAKMSIYNDLLGARWTCTLGTAKYFAAYDIGPGNTLHGHLYSQDSTEDAYYGYDARRKLYWTVSADSTGATESQTSFDGVTFLGTLSDGGTVSKATNVLVINGARKFVVRARGSAGGHPYNVTAPCMR